MLSNVTFLLTLQIADHLANSSGGKYSCNKGIRRSKLEASMTKNKSLKKGESINSKNSNWDLRIGRELPMCWSRDFALSSDGPMNRIRRWF